MTAICLTTMLLVIISTIGNGLILLQKDQAASSYGSNYGLFIAADGTQLKEVERRAEISEDRKSTRLNSSHNVISRMPSSA